MGAIGGCLLFLILIAVFAAIWAIWRYNNLVSLKYQVGNAWKQIDVQLMRRHDLIPNLKANESVRTLMEELTSTENKIGFARQYYNDVATRFNTAQNVFPDSLIAQAFKFQPVELYEITEPAEREVPKVDLNVRPQ